MMVTGRGVRLRRSMRVALAVLALGWAAGGQAQESYPNRPVKILAGFPPGGGTDVTARIIGIKLAELLGQQIVVENHPGASGTIAAELVAKAQPDGYTLLMGLPNSNVVAGYVYPKLAYNPGRDFAPIALVNRVSLVLSLYPGVKATDLKSFVALSKQHQLRYASSGNGSVQHLSTEMLKAATGADLLHVPYKGSGQAVVDLMAGQVDVNFDTMPTVLTYVKSGRLRAIAVGAPKRTVQLPDVPTVAEQGLPGFEATNWYGLFAPAKTPKDVVARLNRDVNAALKTPEMREKIVFTGGEPLGGTSEEFSRFIQTEIVKWGKIIKDANIKFE
ncbi:MAG TPA: tripartite tricarboxylate transporter substrate binding protein [Burkholderiales bacterium]